MNILLKANYNYYCYYLDIEIVYHYIYFLSFLMTYYYYVETSNLYIIYYYYPGHVCWLVYLPPWNPDPDLDSLVNRGSRSSSEPEWMWSE